MASLIEELQLLLSALEDQQIDYAICGGIAVNIYGHPRTTRDIDLLIRGADLEKIFEVTKDLGFNLRAGPLPFAPGTENELTLYRATKADPKTFLTIDLLLVTPAIEDVWHTRRGFLWRDQKITVVSLEGLTRMKLLSGRHQDLADLENLEIEIEDEGSEP